MCGAGIAKRFLEGCDSQPALFWKGLMKMKAKFKIAVWAAALLWIVVLIQIAITRLYVSKTDFVQAFARNQLTVDMVNQDRANIQEGNTCLEGYVPGRLGTEEREKLATELFQTMGGTPVMVHSENAEDAYYVAYGYTTGLAYYKKVNGHRINLNVAVCFEEEKDRTRVIMGTPIINSDY